METNLVLHRYTLMSYIYLLVRKSVLISQLPDNTELETQFVLTTSVQCLSPQPIQKLECMEIVDMFTLKYIGLATI